MTIQYKDAPLSVVELKMDGGSRKFRGYASTFNGTDSYGDTILPGAYQQTLATNGMPKMFFGHKWDLPIGKWLTVVEDEKGLLVEGELTEGNPQADAVLVALRHGTVDGLSIGFRLSKDDYEEKKEGGRLIKSVSRLFEISVVSFPADGGAQLEQKLTALESGTALNDALLARGLAQLGGAADPFPNVQTLADGATTTDAR